MYVYICIYKKIKKKPQEQRASILKCLRRLQRHREIIVFFKFGKDSNFFNAGEMSLNQGRIMLVEQHEVLLMWVMLVLC